jgi:4-hydroxyphenylpyruvate dioxygenase
MILGFDVIELYVGNALQAAHFYQTMFGFSQLGYSGPNRGDSSSISYLLRQGDILIALTNALDPASPAAEHVKVHSDSVRDVGLLVTDADGIFHAAVKKGAAPVSKPVVTRSGGGRLIRSVIAGPGSIVHSLIQREGPSDWFPDYGAVAHGGSRSDGGLTAVDHVAVCVEPGQLNRWTDFYCEVFGCEISHEDNVATARSAMSSKAVRTFNGDVQFVLLEPVAAAGRSQIEEYLAFHQGPGVQHVGWRTDDIVHTVSRLKANGVDFLAIPESYYDTLSQRVGPLEGREALRDLSILADRDDSGVLMQAFTRPLQGRPTFFVEVIERQGSRGFGAGNIRALFEAVEREQATRGSLQS